MPCEINWVDICESTQTLGFEILRKGHEGPQWILTKRQTGGIGQRGRGWFDGDGNLMGSRICVLPVQYPTIGALAFGFGAIIAQTLSQYIAPDHAINVKWPNDILINNAKVAEILIQTEFLENEKLGVVVGLGLNIESSPIIEGAQTGHLKQFSIIRNISIEDIIAGIECQLINSCLFEIFNDSGDDANGEFHKWIGLMWDQYGYGRNRILIMKTNDYVASGHLIGLGTQGQLIFEDNRGYQHALTQSVILYD